MANYQNPSQTSKGKIEDFNLQIARGHVSNHYHKHLIGAVPAMSQNESGTIWDIDDTRYPWASFSSAQIITIPAVNAADTGASVILIGLDDNFKSLQETVIVSSSTATTSINSFRRLFEMIFISTSTNVGAIVARVDGVSGTIVSKINISEGKTQNSIYTIPADTTGYLIKGVCTCQANADATVKMYVRSPALGTFVTTHSFEVSGTGGSYDYEFIIPTEIPEKSDIDVVASVRSNNARISLAYDIILIDK